MASIAKTSTEFLYGAIVTAFDPASPDGAADPTTLDVFFAFVAPGAEPADGDWTAGEWAPDADDGTHRPRILIGSNGGVDLDRGHYDEWQRVEGTTEDPQRRVGHLEVY